MAKSKYNRKDAEEGIIWDEEPVGDLNDELSDVPEGLDEVEDDSEDVEDVPVQPDPEPETPKAPVPPPPPEPSTGVVYRRLPNGALVSE